MKAIAAPARTARPPITATSSTPVSGEPLEESVAPATSPAAGAEAIKKAFEYSQKGIGLSFVEIVATCNSGWKMSPTAANKWMVENMFPKYPLGDIKDVLKQE